MLKRPRARTGLIVVVIALLACGCPLQFIVHAYDLDMRTGVSWRDRAGRRCKQLHQAVVEQASLTLVPVQADEIRVKERQCPQYRLY